MLERGANFVECVGVSFGTIISLPLLYVNLFFLASTIATVSVSAATDSSLPYLMAASASQHVVFATRSAILQETTARQVNMLLFLTYTNEAQL